MLNIHSTDYTFLSAQTERKVLKRQIRKAGISRTEEEPKTTVDENTKRKNFTALCKEFPSVAFVVEDATADYRGICDTSSFGDKEKVSINLVEDILVNYEENHDYIAGVIKGIINNYDIIKSEARGEEKYTSVTLHYTVNGLTYFQTCWPDYPDKYRNPSTQISSAQSKSNIIADDNHYQALLMKVQHESLERLFHVGENKHKHYATQPKKVAKMYQRQFIYE